MRFAYIDSHGNEVAIPSLDALALRVELGAIGPDTELYDAQADRWGPARSHEIFHTLSREAASDGYTAPPPPPPAPEPRPSAADPADDDPAVGDAPDESASLEELLPAFDLTADFSDPTPAPAREAEPAPDPAPEPEAPRPGGESGEMEMDFDLRGVEPRDAEGDADDEMEVEPPSDEDVFDFGSMDTLELDEPLQGQPGRTGAGTGGGPELGDEMLLEGPLGGDEDYESVPGGGGDLDLEPPLSAFSEGSPPAWMEQDGPQGLDEAEDDGAMDFRPRSDEDPDEELRPPPRRAAPPPSGPSPARSRPSPPRRKQRRSVTAPLLGILAAGVLAAAGWLGWQALQAGGGEAETVARPPVTLPEIPADLVPLMREVGEEALAATVSDLGAMADASDMAEEPRQDWLSGVYLANAGQFSDVRSYWDGIAGFVDRAREADAGLFHQAYQEGLAARGVAPDTAALLLARADSGFLATEPDRTRAYDQVDDLVAAALELHTFLVANEGEIGYDPAAGGMSADPILEAVPSTPELGEEMWDRVDRITGALDRLGTLDRVTTDRLLTVLFDRIRQAGFR